MKYPNPRYPDMGNHMEEFRFQGRVLRLPSKRLTTFLKIHLSRTRIGSKSSGVGGVSIYSQLIFEANLRLPYSLSTPRELLVPYPI